LNIRRRFDLINLGILFNLDAKLAETKGLYRLLPLAGLTPAATLSVVTSLHTETTNQSLPTLNFQSEYWHEGPFADRDMSKMASILSEEQVMPQLTAPALNSSYTVQFYGPTFLCEEASISEQDQHSMALWNESEVFTSWTLQMYNDGKLDVTSQADLSFLILSISALDFEGWESYNQFWAQTANFSAVCSIANASFEVDVDYLNGVQTISQRDIAIINLIDSVPAGEFATMEPAYSSIFTGLLNALSGNITITSSGQTGSFNVANTGLITCHEIFWWLNPEHYNSTPIGTNATYDTSMWLPVSDEYSLCRNRSISLAIQDLANNFTISFLSIPDATVDVSTPVTITAPQNIYHYDSRNLLISYAAGIAATIFAVIVGLMAIHSNGVCHSTSFSAIMTSTIGNRQMSDLSKGQSIGAQPLSKMVAEKEIRLGVIKDQDDEAEKDEWGDPISRTGFALDGTVMKLMKGVKCS
jgi:hypothetical protein